MPDPIDHHFLPTFYLKGFVDPISEQDGLHEEFFWQYAISKARWRRRGYTTKQLVSSPRLYTTTGEDGLPSSVLETRVMGPFDGIAARIVREKLSKGLALTLEEELRFAFFLALMHLRVPRQIGHMETLLNRMGQRELQRGVKKLIKSPTKLEASLRRYAEATGKDRASLGLNAENLLELMPTVEANRNGVLGSALLPSRDLAATLLSRRWVFFWTDGAAFVTSDVPCVLHDSTKPPNFYPGFASKNVEMTFAITSRLALLIVEDDGGVSREYTKATRRTIARFNDRAIAYAHELVVAPRVGCLGCDVLPVGEPDRPHNSAHET